MKTPARSDNSVQFSLGELLKLEDERVGEEARAREASERAAIQAKIEAERQARLAEEAALRASHEAEARRRQAELDELARREAMQKATVEQARIEVDARTRAEERERERQHELALTAARAAAVTEKPAGLGPLLGAMGLGGGLMLVVSCVLHFAVNQPAHERRLADLELRATSAEQKVTEAESTAARSKKTVSALEDRVKGLEADNATLRATSAPPPKPPTALPSGHKPPTTPRVKETEAKCVDDRDPMCFTIKGGH